VPGTLSTPTTIDYTSRDYASLLDSMLSYAAVIAPEWQGAANADPNDFGVVLIELFASMGDILSYYTDRVASESFLSTAQERSSVLAQAALLDYVPRSATSATVSLIFTVLSPNPIVIPAGFAVSTIGDGSNDPVQFQTDSDVVVAGSSSPQTVVVPATEGVVVNDEVVATSTGSIDAMFTLQGTPVVADSVVVWVVTDPMSNGNVWFPVTNLLDAQPTDNAYAISIDGDGALTLLFGDGVNGSVPPRGSVIHCAYRVGGGSDGNVLAGTLVQVVDPTDVVYATLVDGVLTPSSSSIPPQIDVVNQVAAAGGTDSESLDSIRANAPLALRANDRAITLADYEALALSVPQVLIAKANAVATVYTNVTLYLAPPGGAAISQDTLNNVVRYINARSLAGVSVVATGPQYVSIDVELNVNVDDRYSQSQVSQSVQNALEIFLEFDNVSFGGRVAVSDIYSAVTAIDGVTSVVVAQLSAETQSGVGDVVLRDNELPIAGVFTLNATGGITSTYSLIYNDIIGDGSGVQPDAPTNLVLELIRCDPDSTHVELTWDPTTNATQWDLQVDYLDHTNAVVETQVIGPFPSTQAVLDLPFIGYQRASQISFTVLAYNGAFGPVAGTPITADYTCEG
jgi:uncharacterized phage protein gp47/JayE